MHIRHLFFLLVIPVYGFAVTDKAPAHDFKMVDLKNGLTAELLAVGPTSLTIRIEWPLEMETNEMVQFYLIGKLDIKERGWDFLTLLTFDQSRGKATVEVLYSELSWNEYDEYKLTFQEKAWFAIRVPRRNEDNRPYSVGIRGMYEEDDEVDEEEYARMYEELRKEFEGEPPSREDEVEIKHEKLEVKSNPFWLYASILLGLCAAFYFMQRKTKTRN